MILHAIFLNTPHGLLHISLSDEYDVQLAEQQIRIDRAAKTSMPRSLQPGVASFHTLFGANGSGKTGILLQIIEGLGREPEAGDISVLYSLKKRLLLFCAPGLEAYDIKGRAPVRLSEECPSLQAIFYTSSPYENARRSRVVGRAGCLDVSPRYGDTNKLDGVALLEIQDLIPEKFIGNASMGISHNLLTTSGICERLSELLNRSEHGADAGSVLRGLIYRKNQESLRKELLRLRILCSMANACGPDSDLGRTWPVYIARTLDRLIDEIAPDMSTLDGVLVRQTSFDTRRRVLEALIGKMQRRVAEQYDDADRIIDTLEVLANWILNRKRGMIHARLQVFQRNLFQTFQDRDALQMCAALGLVAFSLDKLSSGQTAIAVFCAALYGALQKVQPGLPRDEQCMLLIDEGEMFLHLKWQREYIQKILSIVELFPDLAGRLHILLCTHSLIVAADTPPNSLIDIEQSRTINGFGLGPKSLLEDVYRVGEFSGTYTHPALSELAAYFGNGERRVTKEQALLTAQALADENIRDYLVERIRQESAR